MRHPIGFLLFALATAMLAGCFFGERAPVDSCPAGTTAYGVDTGATLSYAPGVDAGYYIAYAGGGHWHFEWTCDTKLSASGCNFTGTVTAPTPPTGIGATCFQCEPDDLMSVTPSGSLSIIQFDTITTSGIDGIDFTTTPGSAIHIDLQIDGLYQNELVWIPSGGTTANAVCNPVDLVPQ